MRKHVFIGFGLAVLLVIIGFSIGVDEVVLAGAIIGPVYFLIVLLIKKLAKLIKP
jgi:hypothetical protein